LKSKREKFSAPAKPLVKPGDGSPKPAIDPWNKLQWESWAQLMKRVQEGDQEAYRQFLDEIGPVLYNFVRRRVFNPEMVRDVYQEVLLTLHKARHTYESSRPLGPWLFTVTRNSILDALGKNRKFAEREVPMEILPDTSELERDGTLDDQLFKALQSLPESNRRAVELLKLKGMSLEDAAKKMGISVAALKVRAHRGYRQLRELLRGKGI
jgi:RNA polymerase sigma factor (sigma-70 family)